MGLRRRLHAASFTKGGKDEGKDQGRCFRSESALAPGGRILAPVRVIYDLDLTLSEKRAILASWASDACALEATPELRELPKGRLVLFDEIMDALRSLDHDDGGTLRKYQKLMRRRAVFDRPRRSNDQDKTIS